MLPNLNSHPEVVAEYQQGGGFTAYSIPLPVSGNWLVPVFLGNLTPQQASDQMEAFAAQYNADYQAAVFKPMTIILVGYVLDMTGITVYMQYLPPEHKFTVLEWSNWPNTPAIAGPVGIPPLIQINLGDVN